jgi:hypothetical protein
MCSLLEKKINVDYVNKIVDNMYKGIVVYLTSSCVNWTFFGTPGPLKRSFQPRGE